MSEQKEVKKEEIKKEEKIVEVKEKPLKETTKDFIFEDMAVIKIGEQYGFRPEDTVRVGVSDKEREIEVVTDEGKETVKVKVLHAVTTSEKKLDKLKDALSGQFAVDGHIVKAVRPEADIIADYREMIYKPEELREKIKAMKEKAEKIE